MKTLLDTHALLWLITNDKRLSQKAKEAFMDQDNSLFFSAASFWEICIKKTLGKLSLAPGWIEIIRDEMKTNSIHWLPVEMSHCAELINLPFHHRYPFDRMLIAQTLSEKMQLLSCDKRLSDYGIIRVW
jgi:PIN domain nuclease of toxin-antitoxin system